VFADGDRGGNLAPVVLDAEEVSDAQMQDIARQHGHESAFVLPFLTATTSCCGSMERASA
jgi:predicted PhzF superfamily epimerase YddE/YHI9